MKKFKIISFILILFIMVLIKNNYSYASRQVCFNYDTKQEFETFDKSKFSTSTDFYCGEIADSFEWGVKHKFRLVDGGYKYASDGKTVLTSTKYYWQFRSDDANETDRRMAWLAKYLTDGSVTINGTKKTIAKGYKAYYDLRASNGKDFAKANTWQGAFWLWQQDAKLNGSDNTKYFMRLCFENASTGNTYTNSIWDQAIKDAKQPKSFTAGTPKASTSALTMSDKTGSFNMQSCSGKITKIVFNCSNGNSYTIPFNHSEPYDGETQLKQEIRLFKTSDYNEKLLVQDIKKGTTVYVKIRDDLDVKINSVKYTVENSGEGFAAKIIPWYDDTGADHSQNLAQIRIVKGTPEPKEFNITVKQACGKITVRKIDYDDNTLLDGSKFVILAKGTVNNKYDGWIGYNTNTHNITTANSWSDAYYFETGQGYTGQSKYQGEFTLDYLPYGDYFIFEVATSSNEYSLKGQPGYSANSDYTNILTNNSWKMVDKNGNGIESVLIGSQSSQANFTGVCFADGTQYYFKPWKFADGTNVNYCNYLRIKNYYSISGKRHNE